MGRYFMTIKDNKEYLIKFVKQSYWMQDNFINPNEKELEELERFINLEFIDLSEIEKFLSIYEPMAELRDKVGMNLTLKLRIDLIETFNPLNGSSDIKDKLESLLQDCSFGYIDAYDLYIKYQLLAPFTQGNEISGQAVWLWKSLKEKDSIYPDFLSCFLKDTLRSYTKIYT